MYDLKQRKTASSGEQDSGDIKKTKGPLQAGSKTVEIQIADGTSKTRHRRTPNFKPPAWMVVDGVVVSKVNFSNQHLRLLQAPSSLMKYKNETNARSHISQYHTYLKLPLKYQPRIRQIT